MPTNFVGGARCSFAASDTGCLLLGASSLEGDRNLFPGVADVVAVPMFVGDAVDCGVVRGADVVVGGWSVSEAIVADAVVGCGATRRAASVGVVVDCGPCVSSVGPSEVDWWANLAVGSGVFGGAMVVEVDKVTSKSASSGLVASVDIVERAHSVGPMVGSPAGINFGGRVLPTREPNSSSSCCI